MLLTNKLHLNEKIDTPLKIETIAFEIASSQKLEKCMFFVLSFALAEFH